MFSYRMAKSRYKTNLSIKLAVFMGENIYSLLYKPKGRTRRGLGSTGQTRGGPYKTIMGLYCPSTVPRKRGL